MHESVNELIYYLLTGLFKSVLLLKLIVMTSEKQLSLLTTYSITSLRLKLYGHLNSIRSEDSVQVFNEYDSLGGLMTWMYKEFSLLPHLRGKNLLYLLNGE